MRRSHLLISTIALLFTCGPLLLLAGGVRADEFENRRLAEPPKWSQGWSVFEHTTAFVVDHMPLREQAIAANSWIVLNVWRSTPTYGEAEKASSDLPFAAGAAGDSDTPTERKTPSNTGSIPQVLRGSDGWLFFGIDYERSCLPALTADEAVSRWERLVKAVRASGRPVVLIVAPDKTTVYGDLLEDASDQPECSKVGRDDLWDRLERSPVAEIVPLREELAARRRDEERDLYFRLDTHWNTVGAHSMLVEVLAGVDGPKIGDDELDRDAPIKREGDLSVMLGAPEIESFNEWRIERPGVSVPTARSGTLPGGTEVLITQTGNAIGLPMIAGRTLIIGDSFGSIIAPSLVEYTERLDSVHWGNSTGSTPPGDLVAALSDSDTVILEIVERDFARTARDVITPRLFQTIRSLPAVRSSGDEP